MKVIDRGAEWLVRFLEWMLVLFGTAMVLLTFLSAVVRKFGMAITWGDEIIRYLFIYATYVGSIIAVYRGKHMMVDVIIGSAKGVFDFILWEFSDLVMMGFSILLVYGGVKMLDVARVDYSPILHIPIPYIYLAIPISGGLMAALCLLQIIKRAVKFAKNPKEFRN